MQDKLQASGKKVNIQSIDDDSDKRGDREDNPMRFQICDGLKIYYESMDAEYNYDFSIGCEDNGIDDDGIIDA